MRSIIRHSLPWLAMGMVIVSPLSAVTNVGHGRLVGTATARLDSDSNVYVSGTKKASDIVGTANGELRYIQDASEVTFEAGVGLTALAFADHDELNVIDPRVSAKLGYKPSDKTDFTSDIGYARNTVANEALNDRTKSNDFTFNAQLEQNVTEKLGLRGRIGYSSQDYSTVNYSDVFSYTLGVDAVHYYSPKLKLIAGITTIENWTSNRSVGRRDPSGKDWRYTVGAEGEISPKVTGKVSAGLVSREFNTAGLEDTNAFYFSSSLAWAAAEKTIWTLTASQDLSLSAADQSLKSSVLAIGFQQGLSEKVTLDGSVGFDHANFSSVTLQRAVGATPARLVRSSRIDDGVVLRARLNYVLTADVTADLSAGYRNNDSTDGSANLKASTYDRFNIGAGLSVRF
ncbi:MAG: hypothetical protein RLZZ15_4512 [Verrucomicrobiota bacterium]|jgi:hypothetical protein